MGAHSGPRRGNPKAMTVVEPYPFAVDLAWAAGLYDGEGSSGLYKTSAHKANPRASLAQNERETLERFHDAIGGIGAICAKKTAYQWQAWRTLDIMLLAWMLWPYLSEPKRRQFERTLANEEHS